MMTSSITTTTTTPPPVRLADVPKWLRGISSICKDMDLEMDDENNKDENENVQFALPVCALETANGETLYQVLHSWSVDWRDVPYMYFLDKWFLGVSSDRRRELLADTKAYGQELDVDHWQQNMFQRDDQVMYSVVIFKGVFKENQRKSIEMCICNGAVRCLNYEMKQFSGGHARSAARYLIDDFYFALFGPDANMNGIDFAAFLGKIDVVKAIIDHYDSREESALNARLGYSCGSVNIWALLLCAARGGQIAAVNWFLEVYPETLRTWPANGGDLIANAAQSGSLALVQSLVLDRRFSFAGSDLAITSAAEKGHLHIVEWLHAQGATYDYPAFCRAAKNGHLPMLEWLRAHHTEQQMDWRQCNVTLSAIESGKLEVLQWARANGCPWANWRSMSLAAEKGHLDMIRWARNGQRLRSQVCPWGECTLKWWVRNYGASNDTYACLRENDCPAGI